MSSKSKKRPSYPMTLTKAVSHALVIFLWAFCAAFSPSPEAFDRAVFLTRLCYEVTR